MEQTGSVLLVGGLATITFRRVLRHTPERVWRAITDPGELSQWLLHSAIIDARTSGRIEYVSTPEPIVWYGKILTWDPPRVYEHEFNTDEDPRWADHVRTERTVARWELAAIGAHTQLTLTFRGFTPGVASGFAPGTHAFLERLEALLAGAPAPDWLERFEALRSLYWTSPDA
jgi:uncharacterized protein YndB with AHSA1/START domain